MFFCQQSVSCGRTWRLCLFRSKSEPPRRRCAAGFYASVTGAFWMVPVPRRTRRPRPSNEADMRREDEGEASAWHLQLQAFENHHTLLHFHAHLNRTTHPVRSARWPFVFLCCSWDKDVSQHGITAKKAAALDVLTCQYLPFISSELAS